MANNIPARYATIAASERYALAFVFTGEATDESDFRYVLGQYGLLDEYTRSNKSRAEYRNYLRSMFVGV